MRKLGLLFIGLATVIVLLHSITPHKHHKYNQTYDHSLAEVKNDSSLISWLQFIFHPDLGEEHLEKFQNEHPLELAIPNFALISVAILIAPQLESKLEHHTLYAFSVKVSDHFSPTQHRGPPTLV